MQVPTNIATKTGDDGDDCPKESRDLLEDHTATVIVEENDSFFDVNEFK